MSNFSGYIDNFFYNKKCFNQVASPPLQYYIKSLYMYECRPNFMLDSFVCITDWFYIYILLLI